MRCGILPEACRHTDAESAKGTRGITVLLEQEAQNAFEERKHAAKRYGEEAGTKLLFPMMLMLGIVMVILLVPAVLAFQI